MSKNKIILEKGKYIRFKGKITIYSPYRKEGIRWIGGSSWTVKNPLIRIGRCKHKPKKISWVKNTDFMGKYKKGEKKRTYFEKGKEMIVCEDCGYTIKFGKELAKDSTGERK